MSARGKANAHLAPPEHADVVVIGGGIVGAATLFHLATTQGVDSAVLLEQRRPGAGASAASGAFLKMHFHNDQAEADLTRIGLHTYANWDDLVGQGTTCGYQGVGYLRVEGEETRDELLARSERLRAMGVRTDVLTPQEAQELAPDLIIDDIAIAAWEPDAGYAHAQAAVSGFITAACAARASGPHIQTRYGCRVTTIRVNAGRVIGVETNRGPIATERVILTAGAWAADLLTPLGLTLPVEQAWTQWIGIRVEGATAAGMPTISDGVLDTYFRSTQPESDVILLGLGSGGRRLPLEPDATPEIVPNRTRTTAEAKLIGRLRSAAAPVAAGGGAGPISVAPDSLPILDRHPQLDGLHLFTACNGSHFKTAPAIGQLLAQWSLTGSQDVADVSSLSLARFGDLSTPVPTEDAADEVPA